MFRSCCSILLALAAVLPTVADDAVVRSLPAEFEAAIVPLINQHCLECHGPSSPEASLNLAKYQRLEDVVQSHPVWESILHRVEAGEMPPTDADSQLSAAKRQSLVGWIRAMRQHEAQRTAGDPGAVPARRLSNSEYDYCIRDLTGVDIRPTKTFPVDPANEAGFDNSADSLSMSPALMKKYLEAARAVVDHLVLTPTGIRFASHEVVTDTDRDKYCVKRIVEFYQRQPTNYADYFFTAWSYRHRESLGKADASIEQIAIERSVSPKYLALIWTALTEPADNVGPLAMLQSMWNDLPDSSQASEAQVACGRMRDYIIQVRKQFVPKFNNLKIDGVHSGSQPFVLWKNKQYANHRRRADFSFLEDKNRPSEHASSEFVITPPAAEDRERFMTACKDFCSVFPDAFYISERGRDYVGKSKDEQEKGRLLSAGFHSMMGYFRDDSPLCELILDEAANRELNSLWQELDFVASAPQRQYQGFLWFERTDSRFMRDPEFDFARPEDKAALTEPLIQQLAECYWAKASSREGTEIPLQAIREYFRDVNAQIRWVEQARLAAEPFHLDAVVEFAARAYRRPLTAVEQVDLREFYQQLRSAELSHEEAIQDTIVSVLMSPRFCYRVDLLCNSKQVRPLDNFELASRLSFFLWSSVPDDELLAHAAAGDLHTRDVLLQQTRRMLSEDRCRALATEFGGNWLDFRRFEEHNSIDRERFPMFNDELRSAMFEEPIRFMIDVIQHDRSSLDFLHADRTFVNSVLAQHYGIESLSLTNDEWVEVGDASQYGRGGLLSMAVFLTKNAPGLRTSPVKRGYWVVRRLLGERIPPPPPDVPELPNDEAKLERSLRETLAAHRDHSACAGCHNRFDAIGLAFEGFGPIGERRTVDLGGRPVDTQAVFPDGSQRDGVAELQSYLQERREADFLDNLARKLVSYGLGRTLLLSDELLIQEMQTRSQAQQYRFSTLIETIVASPQFLNKRYSFGSLSPVGKAQD